MEEKQNKIYLRSRRGAEPLQKQLLEDWERNAYDLVKLATEEMPRRCISELTAAVDSRLRLAAASQSNALSPLAGAGAAGTLVGT